jgi:isopentenyl phosphate kinase
MPHPDELVFLKLGGSLITDKRQPLTAHPATIRRLAKEVAEAIRARPDLGLIIGHGSGSYGHTAAKQHKTQDGVHSREDWRGFATVATIAAQLNGMMMDTLHDAGVPVFRVQPSASAQCEDGRLVEMALTPIRQGLANGLVPLVYGDVAFDSIKGGTIISTENLFAYLAMHLLPTRILLAGIEEGVLDNEGCVIPEITPQNMAHYEAILGGSHGTDVTGGMLEKVRVMLRLCETLPGLEARIFTGVAEGAVGRALVDPGWEVGTRLTGGQE